MMLKKMFVVMLSLSAPSLAMAGERGALEFIPVTLGLEGHADCLTSAGMCYLPSTPDTKLIVDDAQIEIGDDGEHVLLVTLNEKDGEALKQLTATHVGEYLAVMVQGQVVFTGQIKERLESNKLQISVNDADAFAKLTDSLK